MRPQYSLVTGAAAEPVTYEEAAAHLRVDSDDDQCYIDGLVTAARLYVDSLTGRLSAQQTWKLTATAWEDLFGDVPDRPIDYIDPRLGLLSGRIISPYVI